ncbi:MAG: histidinol dehydrogenase [Firmicutes bacterium]|jgi:histidinol dehydrogenase|nr:histidinol dehydrogenase [Bacillota bacterium]
MKRYELAALTEREYRKLLRRSETDISAHLPLAMEVINRVREEGDKALLDYTMKFDGISLEGKSLRVTEKEIAEAFDNLDNPTRDTLQYAAENIKKFHREQLPPEMWLKEIDGGLLAGEKVTPISDVCLYVPRGKGSFPSVMLMLGIPAVIAGVPRIVVCTPPGAGGEVDALTLAAAHLAGIREIYRVGGMQAIAAVAYGTESIPRCRKVVGPGNAYVNAAKRLLYGVLDVGLPAGPSEAIILADEHADPRIVALDLLIEAEHGPDSSSLLVTHSRELAEAVARLMPEMVTKLPEEKRRFVETVFNNYGGIVLTATLEESIRFINDFAPEHLEILTADPFSVLPQIKNAGEILLGAFTPITLCNFLLGPNAILPTGSFAKTFSGVSVHDFLKRSSFGYVTPEGFDRVREAAVRFAEAEGFWAHAMAVRERGGKPGEYGYPPAGE